MKKNVLCSYPRSGNHLTRFFIELLSERPTSGCKGNSSDIPIYKNICNEIIAFNITNEKFYYYKHHSMPDLQEIDSLIFILRDPREVLLRHNNYKINIDKGYSFDMYIKNIEFYLKFKGKKILFFYEDIITKKKDFIKSLYSFLSIKKKFKLEYTLNNIDHLYDISATCVNRAWGGINSNFNVKHYYTSPLNIHKDELDAYIDKKIKKNKNFKFIVKKYNL
jgi:hypothetical protein